MTKFGYGKWRAEQLPMRVETLQLSETKESDRRLQLRPTRTRLSWYCSTTGLQHPTTVKRQISAQLIFLGIVLQALVVN